MSKQEIKTVLRLSSSFDNYVIQHPAILNGITRKDCIVFTVKSQPRLWKKNLALAKRVISNEKRRCFLAMRTRGGWKLERVTA